MDYNEVFTITSSIRSIEYQNAYNLKAKAIWGALNGFQPAGSAAPHVPWREPYRGSLWQIRRDDRQ